MSPLFMTFLQCIWIPFHSSIEGGDASIFPIDDRTKGAFPKPYLFVFNDIQGSVEQKGGRVYLMTSRLYVIITNWG
jgi:hypothetical protein